MSNIALPTELETKANTLLSLVSHHIGTATFQRIQSWVLAKTSTKLQAFLTDSSKSIEERAGVIDELTQILQSEDFTKLPPPAGAQAAAPHAPKAMTPAPTPLMAPKVNGQAAAPAAAVPPPPPPAPAPVAATPADPMAQFAAALAALMPKPAAAPAPVIDEAAIRKLVREEMATVLSSIVDALRQ